MSRRVQTIDSDESGDEPHELSWNKRKGKKRKARGKHAAMTKAPGPTLPVESQQDDMPEVYAGDPTEQEVIDNVRNLPDISRPGGKVKFHDFHEIILSAKCLDSLKMISCVNGCRGGRHT